jgi:hypothetical protein
MRMKSSGTVRVIEYATTNRECRRVSRHDFVAAFFYAGAGIAGFIGIGGLICAAVIMIHPAIVEQTRSELLPTCMLAVLFYAAALGLARACLKLARRRSRESELY